MRHEEEERREEEEGGEECVARVAVGEAGQHGQGGRRGEKVVRVLVVGEEGWHDVYNDDTASVLAVEGSGENGAPSWKILSTLVFVVGIDAPGLFFST